MVRPPATEIQSYRYSNRIVARRLTLPLNRDPRRQPPARRLRHPRACSRRPMVYRCGTHRHTSLHRRHREPAGRSRLQLMNTATQLATN